MPIQPGKGFLERVKRIQGMRLRIRDDSNAGGAGRQRNQPNPVTGPHQMIGAVPTGDRLVISFLPGRIVRPIVDLERCVDAEPDRVSLMRRRLLQAQLPFEQRGAAARVGHPTALRLPGFPFELIGYAVLSPAAAKTHLQDLGAVKELHSAFAAELAQMVLESASIQLVTGRRGKAASADFQSLIDGGVVARAKEETQTELGKLLLANVLLEPQHFAEVVGGDFHGGLAHLEGGFGSGMSILFQHEDARLGRTLAAMKRQAQAGQAASQDDDVVSRISGSRFDHVLAHIAVHSLNVAAQVVAQTCRGWGCCSAPTV